MQGCRPIITQLPPLLWKLFCRNSVPLEGAETASVLWWRPVLEENEHIVLQCLCSYYLLFVRVFLRVELKSEKKGETGIEANSNKIDLSLGFYVQQTLK